MSREHFEDDCPGCRPCIVDPQTFKKFSDDHPAMRAINSVWQNTTTDERRAFHDFTCLNSRAPDVMAVMERLQERFADAIRAEEQQ